jgi:large subunit ribosomal protein L13
VLPFFRIISIPQVVGRFAAKIAGVLQGKHKPNYLPNVDVGDTIVVLNSKSLQFTGNKWQDKIYRKHSGYVGGMKEVPAYRWREKAPERVLLHAVRGMLPKNKFRLNRISRLKIFPGEEHTFAAQLPNQPELKKEIAGDDMESLKPIPGLVDSWDFPADFPEWRKKQIWGLDKKPATGKV